MTTDEQAAVLEFRAAQVEQLKRFLWWILRREGLVLAEWYETWDGQYEDSELGQKYIEDERLSELAETFLAEERRGQ